MEGPFQLAGTPFTDRCAVPEDRRASGTDPIREIQALVVEL